MASTTAHTTAHMRFYRFPYQEEVFDGIIERIAEVRGPRHRSDVEVDFWALRTREPATPVMLDGRPWEIVHGERARMRLRFRGARWFQHSGIFADAQTFAALPANHSARRIFAITHMRLPGRAPMYWWYTDTLSGDDVLCFGANGCDLDALPGAPVLVDELRRWSARPPTLDRLVPLPRTLHQRYGGDPIAIHLGQRIYRERLFVGGLRHQRAERSLVDHVVNLTSDPNPWNGAYGRHPNDRYAHKLEAVEGMGANELLGEAQWVAERLRAGRRVLVHCVAGVNRSSTVCCAALMLLEGITAEAALERVRERHPEAAPDPYYWFLLRWLAASGATNASGMRGPKSALDSDLTRRNTLREVASVG